MKIVLLGLLCMMLSSPCTASFYTETWLERVNASTDQNHMNLYTLDRSVGVFGACVKAGISYWGFTQNTPYGRVTGVLFGMGAVVQFYEVRW